MAKKLYFEKDGITSCTSSPSRIEFLRRQGHREVAPPEADISPSVPAEHGEGNMGLPDLEGMGMRDLRAMAKAAGLSGYSSLPKNDLIQTLKDTHEKEMSGGVG